MKKGYLQKRKFRKACIAALCCVTVTCTGLAAACATDDEDESVTYPKGEDAQLLKNGNFEYFTIPDDAVYLIKTPDNWSRSGDTSSAMSGIISTAPASWAALTDSSLADTLDFINDLDSSDDDYAELYVDYNGMTSGDLLYRDTYAALLDSDDVADSYIKYQGYENYFGIVERDGGYYIGDTQVYKNDDADADYYLDEELTVTVRQAFIDNPLTHYDVQGDEESGYYFTDEDGRHDLYVNDTTGDYYYLPDDVDNDDATESDKIYISNVLMIHNAESRNNGISQYYSSSTTITLQANTAAEISVWVKTSDLKFDKGYDQNADEGRGAYIEVVQTVSGSTIDSFGIKAINTEKIIANNPDIENSNGWLQYTIYVNACDFADSTVTINLGLGGSDTTEDVSGYAFFDDLTVTQYIDLSDEGCSYGDHADEVVVCTLTDEGDDKLFIADKEVRSGDSLRYSENFYYLIDLASESIGTDSNTYSPVTFGDNLSAGLTTEKSGGKIYVSSLNDNGNYAGVTHNALDGTEKLPSGMNDNSRPTDNDLIGIYDFNYTFTAQDTVYFDKLNAALNFSGNLPKLTDEAQNNMLVMLSAYGAAYTATIDDGAFTVAEDGYAIVSFWVKTSDLDGNTAATVKIYDKDNDETNASFTIDSTGITTDVGDNEDIYDGWVQCFFFVHNDTDETKTFNIDFSFGNTYLASTSITSYKYGWVALANMQTLEITDTVFDLVTSGDYSATLTITDENAKNTGTAFDDAAGTSNIKTELSDPANYSGVNGGSSYVTDNSYLENFDSADTNSYSGLINREYFDKYDNNDLYDKIAEAFNVSYTDAAALWNEVFGSTCYQPLIIINNLRTYADNAQANENSYTMYYVLVEDGYEGDYVETTDGKRYRKVAADEAYDENVVYYSLKNVLNYGYIGATSTIAADSYTTISIKVKVSEGATAYVYLVDPDTREILGYSTPEYSYWYDDEGNVLDEEYDSTWTDKEHLSHIVYTLRDDGLYEDASGELYANLNNYTKVYNHYKFEHDSFYDADGNAIAYDNLVEGETYYRTKGDTSILAEHFLCATDGTRVYEYYVEEDEYGSVKTYGYYYLVDSTYVNDDGDEVTTKVRGSAVKAFDTKYSRDYTNITAENAPYFAVIGDTNGDWVTVNFVIHTGSESLSYRLELWSGARENTGLESSADKNGGMVVFDYSAYSVTESNYETLVAEYESNIIGEYKKILSDAGKLGLVASNSENISYYEELFVSLSGDESIEWARVTELQNGYKAFYYTFTLYDSANYVPFNANTAADGETGYDYTQSSYTETLAYFSYDITDGGKVVSYNIFADYSAVDKDIDIGTVTDDEEETTEDEPSYTVWLLVSSIVLVVALLFTLLSLLVRDVIKRIRRKRGVKAQNKNMYRKRERYIKRLHLVKNEEESAEAPSDVEETPAETPSVEEVPAEVTEEPADGETAEEAHEVSESDESSDKSDD